MKNIDFGKKPDLTKIQITKGSDMFEIYFPPQRSQPLFFFLVIFTILWDGMLILILSEKNRLFEGAESILLISFIALGIFLAYACLYILFRKTFFRIDRHEISLSRTLFGRQVRRKVALPKREIINIIFSPSYIGRDSDGDFVTRSAVLRCETETISIAMYKLDGINYHANYCDIQTAEEVEWLASEIGEWLDKPLTIIEYPLHINRL
jgi:hypothetical protein